MVYWMTYSYWGGSMNILVELLDGRNGKVVDWKVISETLYIEFQVRNAYQWENIKLREIKRIYWENGDTIYEHK